MTEMYVRVTGSPSDQEDAEISGTYLVLVGEDTPPDARVNLVLDCFHEKIGIAQLDDFMITVHDAQGIMLDQPEEPAARRADYHASFAGSVRPGPAWATADEPTAPSSSHSI